MTYDSYLRIVLGYFVLFDVTDNKHPPALFSLLYSSDLLALVDFISEFTTVLTSPTS